MAAASTLSIVIWSLPMAKIRFPWQVSNQTQTKTTEAEIEFLHLAYKLILGRAADEAGLDTYMQRLSTGELSHAGVLAEMGSSDEFQRQQQGLDLTGCDEFQWYLQQRDEVMELALRESASLNPGAFDQAWAEVYESGRELIIGQADYAPLHRVRFEELFSAVGYFLAQQQSPRLLEFGVSEFSGFYKRLWPNLQLELSDRPTSEDYPGFNRERSLQLSGASEFHELDLQQPGSIELSERYDVIVLAEVVEHLVVNPVELLRTLVALLRPSGVLYLTTPNFFRRINLERLAQWQNPQEVYPAGAGNWDAHYHHREYGAREMLGFIREAGARCSSFHFSACWESDTGLGIPESELGNMVFAISP
jgi:SAM-dependent methyltransferase